MKHLSVFDCITVENFMGSWDVHYEPLPTEFDEWLKKQGIPSHRRPRPDNQNGEFQDD
jgi:hypothetical protein